MEKEELKPILKSDIIKSEKVMEDFEYTFLDIKQVIKRIEWLKDFFRSGLKVPEEYVLDKIDEAFKELEEVSDNPSHK